MPITDARAINYATTTIRPLCERIRRLKVEIDQAVNRWFIDQAALFPNDSGATLSDRAGSPTNSVITGADVTNVVTQLMALQTLLNGGGVAAVIEKPCINPL